MHGTASRVKTYAKGPIFWEGDAADSMFIIRKGRVKVTKNVLGIMVKLVDLGPGDYFGEIGLLDGLPRSASALADTRVELEEYDRQGFAELIVAEPDFAFTMLRALAKRLRQVDSRLAALVAKGRLPKEDAVGIGMHALC
jgi:CRP-like cAMP-binding protein